MRRNDEETEEKKVREGQTVGDGTPHKKEKEADDSFCK